MMNAPAISVLMPVFNTERFLGEAMDSVLAQTFGDFEVLVVNDGSTDGSRAVVASYSDPRVRIIDNPSNLGLVASLNIGLQHARGRYVARMDGDDVMSPERLRKLFDLMEGDPTIAAAATGVELMDADGGTIGPWDRDLSTPDEASIANMLPRTNCVASVMVRMDVVKALGYSPAQKGVEDWDLLLRMRSRGMRIVRVPEALYRYRMHAASVMGMSKKQETPEVRSLRARHRFLLGDWSSGRLSAVHMAVLRAQLRTIARHIKVNLLPPLARGIHRVLTYSPFALLHERNALRRCMEQWNGQHLFCFPYMCVGGAEQIHVDVLSTVADRKPLVLICGRSADRSFEERFRKSATVVEIGHLVNHPFTRGTALRQIAKALNAAPSPTLLSSLTDTFFDLLPTLQPHVRTFHLQHAFLFQPDANRPQHRWKRAFPRVDHFIFYSSQAMHDWQRFMRTNGIGWDKHRTFLFLSNAVHKLQAPEPHEQMGVLFVGRRSPVKRIEVFLAITDELERKYPGRFRFTVAGYDAQGDHPHVTFHGRVSDPDKLSVLYRSNDVVVQTSTLEGFPMVIMEAMAHGSAILSTPVGDVPNRVTTDFAFLSSTVEADIVTREMTSALLDLEADRPRLQRMRSAAFTKAKEEYGWEAFRQRYRSALINPAASTSAKSR